MRKFTLVLLIASLTSLIRAQSPVSFTIQTVSISGSITCTNPSVKLIACSDYSDVVNYLWTGPSGSFSGANVSITTPGVYTVMASSSNVLNSLKFISIGINTTVPSSFVNPTYTNMNCNILATPQITASCNLTSNATHHFMAPFGGTFVVSVPTATYKPAGPGTYTHVLIDDTNGCETTKTFTIGSTSGIPTFDLTSSQNFTLGCGTKSVAVINISNANTFPAGGPLSYTLLSPSSSGSAAAGVLSNATAYYVNTPGNWTAIVRDNLTQCESCVFISVIQNNVVPNVTIVVPNQILNCSISRIRLQAISSSQNINYSWKSVSGTNILSDTLSVTSQTNSPTITYVNSFTLTSTNDNNLCTSTTVIPVYQNIFTPIASISSGTSNAVLTCLHPTITLTNMSSTGIPPSSGFPSNLGVVAHLWKGPQPLSPATYTSTYNASCSGIYTLNITDLNNGCKAKTSIPVYDGKVYPVVNNPNGPTPFCINSIVNIVPIYAIVSGNANAYLYQWTGPSGSIVNNPTTFTASANALGIYSVVVTNTTSGCSTLGQVIVADCVTGLAKNEFSKSAISVYPNPSKNYFKIFSEQDLKNKHIKIYNTIGTLIYEQDLFSENNTIDLSQEDKGIYILLLTNDNAVIHTGKLIKE